MKFRFTLALLITFTLHVSAKLDILRHLKARRAQLSKNDFVFKEQWFMQFLDHFNPTETRIWQQRYYMNEDHFKNNGPVFLLIGENEPANLIKLTDSFMAYLAEQFGAMCFYLEHRFYGMSQPLTDLSSKNLVYMNIEQVLADVAFFIQEMHTVHNVPAKSKWIIFGGSYGGSLAAWMRLKYPHLVYAAVADSAPLIAQSDFTEYYATVEKLYEKESPSCAEMLKFALKEVYVLLSTEIGQEKLKKMFNLCDPIDLGNIPQNDISNFYLQFLDTISNVALDNKEPTIEETCKIMLDEKRGTFLNRLAAIFDLILEFSNQSCLSLNTFEETVSEIRDIEWFENRTYRQIVYQMCNEVGWFASTTSRPFDASPDTLPIKFFEQLCADSFDFKYPEKLVEGIERTNFIYGGTDISEVISRVAFIYGSNDPWKSFGILKSDNPNITIILIKDVGHCPLETPPSKNDSSQLLEAKKKVQKLINEWVAHK